MGKLQTLRPRVSAVDVSIARPLSTGWTDSRRTGTTTARGYGWKWVKTRRQVLERAGYRCQCRECAELGRVWPAHEVDHVIPKAAGGSDELGNLQAMNRECHRRKTEADAAAMRQGQIWPSGNGPG